MFTTQDIYLNSVGIYRSQDLFYASGKLREHLCVDNKVFQDKKETVSITVPRSDTNLEFLLLWGKNPDIGLRVTFDLATRKTIAGKYGDESKYEATKIEVSTEIPLRPPTKPFFSRR